jgi:hypothetical protein
MEKLPWQGSREIISRLFGHPPFVQAAGILTGLAEIISSLFQNHPIVQATGILIATAELAPLEIKYLSYTSSQKREET